VSLVVIVAAHLHASHDAKNNYSGRSVTACGDSATKKFITFLKANDIDYNITDV